MVRIVARDLVEGVQQQDNAVLSPGQLHDAVEDVVRKMAIRCRLPFAGAHWTLHTGNIRGTSAWLKATLGGGLLAAAFAAA